MNNHDDLSLAVIQEADNQALRYSVMLLYTVLRMQLGVTTYNTLVDSTLDMATNLIKENAKVLKLHPTELDSYLHRVLEQMKENLNRNPQV